MPAKYRDDLGEQVYVTRGLDGCLTVYPLETWNRVYEQYSSLPSTDYNARMFMRIFMSYAVDVDLDAQGRILIPATLIQAAGLEKECVITGVADRVEIWSKERWDALQAGLESEYESFAQSVGDMLKAGANGNGTH